MGGGHLWGRFARFALVKGGGGDLSETSARLTSLALLAPLARNVHATNKCAYARHSALRVAANGQLGDKWWYRENGHV
jgi:hypothetical protein